MILRLDRLRENTVFMRHLRWDVTPEVIFKPRFVTDANKRHLIDETQGFIFYVEALDGPPALMVMKTYNLTSKTIGEVEGAPADLLEGAVSNPGGKQYCGMYPVNQPLMDWIKERLKA